MPQYHEIEWRKFSNRIGLNLALVPDVSCIVYLHASARTARAAWDRRTVIADSELERDAWFNEGIQRASEVAYRMYGEQAARAIQELRKK